MNRKEKLYNENMHLKMMEAINIHALINHDIYYSASVDRVG